MSIQFFYNFCLKDVDKTDLSGDLLTGVRRSYFDGFRKIKDKITSDSDASPFTYDFSIEKDKPMKWSVKDPSGDTVQEVMLSDGGKYYIYFYVGQVLYKRLLFSKHHTLLKGEYFDAVTGTPHYTLEPRKAQNGLCILYTVKTSARPLPLFEEPEPTDERIRQRMQKEFTDYTVVASTDNGIVRFLSDVQLESYRSFKEKCEQELAEEKEETFVEETPLLDKINAKDFNVKRNLSSLLDITRAMEFGVSDGAESADAPAITEEPPEVEETPEEPAAEITEGAAEMAAGSEESASAEDAPASEDEVTAPAETSDSNTTEEIQPVEAQPEESVSDEPAPEEPQSDELQSDETSAAKPDKLIMADGAVYSYYGDLDERGNRSGYGRTLTEQGRTAYEGHYFNDKRSGNGSYFYKNGELCYTGMWSENARHGVGVGVSSRDGSIHVGSWKNNKPEGNGVRLTAEGEIKFVCKELSDGTTVLMHYMPDDTVIISKYNKHGMKIGDMTLSLKDLLL